MNRIETPTIGKILREEFIEPHNISLYRLAKEIKVPPSRILEIVHGKRRITVQTGLKLARYFGTSEKFFISLQADVDIREEKHNIWNELEEISPVHA